MRSNEKKLRACNKNQMQTKQHKTTREIKWFIGMAVDYDDDDDDDRK